LKELGKLLRFLVLLGIVWFPGRSLLGWLYDVSDLALVITSVAARGLAVPLFVIPGRATTKRS
jgi:hypothetical protein